MAEDDPKIRLAIAGGGIAGLAFAIGLHKKSPQIDFHIYEAVAAYKDVGAGLALHLNAISAMGLIHPDVRQTYFDRAVLMGEQEQEMCTEVIMAQGPHKDELVAELGRAKGRRTVARSELMEGLASLLPKDRLSFGKRIKSIAETGQNVKVSFEDGSNIEADCVIGADGIHSLTRRYILGPDHPATEPRNHDGWKNYRTMIPMDEARPRMNEKWTSVVPILLGPRGHINCMPLDKGTRLSMNYVIKGTQLPDDAQIALKPDDYKDYSEDAQQLIRLAADYPGEAWSPIDHDHAPTFYRGRVAMIGDAAHACLPFSGQGAAQSLEDAAVLDHLFSHVHSPTQIEAAFQAYDATRRPRSQTVVDISRKFGRMYCFAEGDMHHDVPAMKKFFAEAGAFSNKADMQKQNDDALAIFEKVVKAGSNGVNGGGA